MDRLNASALQPEEGPASSLLHYELARQRAGPVDAEGVGMTSHEPTLLRSFFLGGFECSSHRRQDGRRLDLLSATAHDLHADLDYASLRAHGMASARDGLRWHLIEQQPGRYDFTSFLPQLEAAERHGVQVIWDLCHYGWPDDIDIWRPAFVDRFVRFASAVARLLRDRSDEVPFYCVVNEPSYWAWAGGDRALMNPLGERRGLELKHQLTRASIAAMQAIREVDPRARFVHVDPIIHAHPSSPDDEPAIEAYLAAQFDAWLMLSGELWPQLGGEPQWLDIVGLNYYPDNQFAWNGPTIERDDPRYRPLRELLADAHRRLARPLLLAETGAEGAERAHWLRYVCDEVAGAMQMGVPVEGVCLYPVLDYPGWTDERHCQTGLLGLPDDAGRRPLHEALADELSGQRRRFEPVSGRP